MSAPVAKSHCATTHRRVARKQHYCGSCHKGIATGTVYLSHKAFPGLDYMELSRPWTSPECADCATRYGRADLLEAAAE